MANWTFTGELGSGKSILAISKVLEYLQAGRKVASNIDIFLHELMPPMSKVTYTRLMDFPEAHELWALGKASNSKNESTFGVVVLDELAVFLNSRDWQGKARDEVIKFLRHVRKQHWHTFFVTQDIESLDAQARRALIEHRVVCSRTDRLSIPILGWLLRLIGGSGKFMQLHIGAVHYGKSEKSPVVEWWKYFGKSLHEAYNTDQVFTDEPRYDFNSPTYYKHIRPFNTPVMSLKDTELNTAYQEGTYTVLSAWHLKGRYMSAYSRHQYLIKPVFLLLMLSVLAFYFYQNGKQLQQSSIIQSIDYLPVTNYIYDGKTMHFTTLEGFSLSTDKVEKHGDKLKFEVNKKWYVTQ